LKIRYERLKLGLLYSHHSSTANFRNSHYQERTDASGRPATARSHQNTDEEILKLLDQPLGKPTSDKKKNRKKKPKKKTATAEGGKEEEEEEDDEE
jgi:hypothetical protein